MHEVRALRCHIPMLVALLAAVGAFGSDTDRRQSPPTGSEALAARLSDRLVALVREAGAIDARTGRELVTERRARSSRQAELDAWFTAKGRTVSPSECATAADRANYLEFRQTMATYGFLKLPARQRRRRIEQIERYARLLRGAGGATMTAVVGATSDPAAVAVRALLERRTAVPVALHGRFFGRHGTTATVSLYFPPTATIYLDIGRLADGPGKLIDGFEHELWHHLLPLDELAPASRNLWWEGFVEAFSETWGRVLADSLPREYWRRRSVSYPVQTAYATLYQVCDRPGSAAFAGGVLEAGQLSRRLQARRGGTELLARVLAEQVEQMLEMPPERQARVETLLHDWRWREDDGTRISIAYLVSGGRLAPERIDHDFRTNRRFLLDFIQALTVVNLQETARHCGRLPPMPEIPRHLRENVLTVLTYVEAPYHQLSNR